MKKILVIDDEKDIGRTLKALLSDEGFCVKIAHTPESALVLLEEALPDLILLDVWFGKSSWDGVHLLDKMRKIYPLLPIIMISGHGSLELAVRAIQKGAYDFIEKPIEIEKLLLSIHRALEVYNLKGQISTFQIEEKNRWPLPFNAALQKACRTDSRMLLKGSFGMPLERLAHDIHNFSSRKKGPFLALGAHQLNTISENILWGQENEEGIQEVGWIEKLKQGTFVILNIQYLSMAIQINLAKIFESNAFFRQGGVNSVPCNVRFIGTSTTQDESLFYPPFIQRLSVLRYEVDDLNSKKKTIALWTELLLKEYGQMHGLPVCSLSSETLSCLEKVDWKGNVNQLKNVLEYALAFNADQAITPDHLLPFLNAGSQDNKNFLEGNFEEARARFDFAYVSHHLALCNWNISLTAQKMGIERSTLHRKLKSLEKHFSSPLVNKGSYD